MTAPDRKEPIAVIRRNETGQIYMARPDGSAFRLSAFVDADLYLAPPSAPALAAEVEALKEKLRDAEDALLDLSDANEANHHLRRKVDDLVQHVKFLEARNLALMQPAIQAKMMEPSPPIFIDSALKGEVERLRAVLQRYVAAYPAFRMKPIGSEGSPARIEQENLMALEETARAALARAEGG